MTTPPPYFAAYYRSLVVQQELGIPRHSRRILDVGCDDTYILMQAQAEMRVGIDANPRIPLPAASIVRALAEDLPLLDGSFDTIFAFDVLEHVVADRAVMHEMTRVLAPDGAIWISTPAARTRFFPWFITPYANRSFGHVRNGYTPDQLITLLPHPPAWEVRWFWWHEPFLRLNFLPLHALSLLGMHHTMRIATRLCYQLDRRWHDGDRGHLLAQIRRRSSPTTANMAGEREKGK